MNRIKKLKEEIFERLVFHVHCYRTWIQRYPKACNVRYEYYAVYTLVVMGTK